MAITDFNAYRSMQEAPSAPVCMTKNLISLAAGLNGSTWLASPFAGSAPTTAVACDNTLTGRIRDYNPAGAATLRLPKITIGQYLPGTWMICDRLSHTGGLSGIVTTAQTTNLPTAALPRYTSGIGVIMCLEIYTVIGTTSTTVSVSYTNTTPTAGRTSSLVLFGATGRREASSCIMIPLQEGDLGVTSVESVTVTATTGTAGNFGVTLFKPLMLIPINPAGSVRTEIDPLINLGACLPDYDGDACLEWRWFSGATGSSGSFNASMCFSEDR